MGGRSEDMARLVRALPDPVLILDRTATVTMANEAARSALGHRAEGQHIAVAIRAPAVLDAVTAALAGAAPAHVEYEVRGPISRSFDAYVAAIGDDVVLVQLKDLTREQQIERMRADFVANASHELRTPLASLSGFIETLLGAARNDVAAREKFLELMRAQAQRMKRLIDDLLSLSRIEMNAHLRPSGTVDLAEAARHVADVMADMAKAEDCSLRLDFPEALNATGDRDEIVQVIQNLVENALKYASGGKRIDISGRRDGGSVELTVRDHGPGIAEEHIPRLTERFYRVSVQESRSRGGTGLGLAIVKHILNRHRGRLIISSKLGEGSSFTIRLPAA
jgi:two-component system, OmpR family, phosphate regulon sensor histidine kinase PhoR